MTRNYGIDDEKFELFVIYAKICKNTDTEQILKRKNILQLHNNFVEAVYSLSVEAKKIFLCAILHLNDKNQIVIHRSDMIREIGIDPRKIKNLKQVLKELMSKIIEIRSLEKEDEWELYQLLRSTKYKDGILTTSIYPELLSYFKIAQERLFTRFNIQNIKPLTSIYAIRLYELAKQYQDTGWREMDLQELKNMLQVGEKYSRIYDFKKYVLEVAKRQINANTDININYELIKQGRSYKKIKLKISQDTKRVQRKSTKKLQRSDSLQELSDYLNRTYRGKNFKNKNGLLWTITKVRAIDKNTAEITATDLEHTTTKEISIKKLEELFG